MPFRCVRPTGDMLLLGLILAGAESEARTEQAAAAARVAMFQECPKRSAQEGSDKPQNILILTGELPSVLIKGSQGCIRLWGFDVHQSQSPDVAKS